jgi:hypothetical protein
MSSIDARQGDLMNDLQKTMNLIHRMDLPPARKTSSRGEWRPAFRRDRRMGASPEGFD